MFARKDQIRGLASLAVCSAVVILISPGILLGQGVSFGFVGGTNLTRDFPISRTVYFDAAYPQGLTAFDLYSDTNSFIAGFAVEVALTKQFALEGNALHRNLYLQRRFILPDDQVRESGHKTVSTWEWPVLLKYRFRLGAMQPFLEAGPSFRTRHDPAPSEPSQFGATLGAGAEFNLGRLRVAPRVRYTRWRYDGDYPRIATKRDQIEFLTAVSYATSPAAWRVHGKKIHFGVIAGIPFMRGLEEPGFPETVVAESQGYVAGLLTGIELNQRLSIEVNGLYRPLRAVVRDSRGAIFGSTDFTVLSWQFPVLARYRVRSSSGIRPVIEAGPSFRLSGNRNGYNPSSVGFTVGAGGETRLRKMTIGPVVRYTRWAEDPNPYRGLPGGFGAQRTRQHQVELLVSFSF